MNLIAVRSRQYIIGGCFLGITLKQALLLSLVWAIPARSMEVLDYHDGNVGGNAPYWAIFQQVVRLGFGMIHMGQPLTYQTDSGETETMVAVSKETVLILALLLVRALLVIVLLFVASRMSQLQRSCGLVRGTCPTCKTRSILDFCSMCRERHCISCAGRHSCLSHPANVVGQAPTIDNAELNMDQAEPPRYSSPSRENSRPPMADVSPALTSISEITIP